MPPKRMHTKSRNGCMTCRRRRVKCDEIRPICTNCTRRELDCVYAAYCPPGRPGISRSPVFPAASSSSSSSSSSASPAPSQALSPRLRTVPLPPPLQQSHTPASTKSRKSGSTTLVALARQFDLLLLEARAKSPSPLPRISLSRVDLDNLSLLHHFTIRTFSSLSNDKIGDEIYRTCFPRVALQNELAMHSLLAVTALHKSKTAGTSLIASHYQMIAASYYDRALSSLRVAVLDPTQDATALFAASSMIAFYSLGCHTGGGPRHVPRVITWIPLVRGIYAILVQWLIQIRQGPLGALVSLGIESVLEGGDFLPLPAPLFELALETSPTSNIPHSGDDEIVDAVAASTYRGALNELRKVWSNFWATGCQIATSIQWLSKVSDEYVLYLRQGRPRALVIFCHYLCTVKKLDGFWWIKGSAQETFVAIEGRLSTRWREQWLEWPRSIIMGDLEAVGEPV